MIWKKTKILQTYTVNRRFQSISKTMLSYCFKCRKSTESKNLMVEKTKNARILFLSSKKSRFIKEQEASGIIGSLAEMLSKILIIGLISF